MKAFFQSCTWVAIVLPLMGCANSGLIGGEELRTYKDIAAGDKLDTIIGYVEYSNDLADIYIKHSDDVSSTQALVALGIIGAGATAAGGLLYGASTDLIKGAGLAAGTTGALASYVRPAESSAALLAAADKMICISRAGRIANSSLGGKEVHDEESELIMDNAIRDVRVSLRKSLARETPSYSEVANRIQNAIESDKNKRKIALLETAVNAEKVRATLQDSVNKCQIIPITYQMEKLLTLP